MQKGLVSWGHGWLRYGGYVPDADRELRRIDRTFSVTGFWYFDWVESGDDWLGDLRGDRYKIQQ
ncbi:MAG: hypothetical protein NT070_18525 [Cyanobacteria bacterium]|nr:hypothetical protein [Cyanobacteriota bacterium]